MKRLYIRAPRHLHRHITLLDYGLHYFERAGAVLPPEEGQPAALKRSVPNEWIDRIAFLAKLHSVSKNRAAVVALQYATRSKLNPRTSVPPDVAPGSDRPSPDR